MNTIEKENRRAVGEVYSQVRAEIFSIFRQVCIAEDICEDLVQEVFVKLLGLDLIVKDTLKGLAVTIAYQKRTDYLRHRAYINNKMKNDMSAWEMERSYTNTEAEVNDILNSEMKVIRCMSEKDRKVYQMTRFEEKTADEIALELNLSKRAVESRLYRTRTMVRDNIKRVIGF